MVLRVVPLVDELEASQRRELTQSVHRSSGSFELVGGGVIFALIGLLIDRAVGSGPWFTIAFAIAGIAGATISLVCRYRAKMNDHALERAELSGLSGGAGR